MGKKTLRSSIEQIIEHFDNKAVYHDGIAHSATGSERIMHATKGSDFKEIVQRLQNTLAINKGDQ